MTADLPAIYVDTSAILRLLFGSPGVKAPLTRCVSTSSQLVVVEAYRVVDRARLAGRLNDLETARKHRELRSLLDRMHLFPVADEVIEAAQGAFSIPLSALHALHAATARVIFEEAGPLAFWTHDTAQAAAAVTLGLVVRGIKGEDEPIA